MNEIRISSVDKVEDRLEELGLGDARKLLVSRNSPNVSPTIVGYETVSGVRSAHDLFEKIGSSVRVTSKRSFK